MKPHFSRAAVERHVRLVCNSIDGLRTSAHPIALGAAMRKLVHLCFGVLKTRQPYQPNYGISA
jgi:transposase